ncbi:hypothetical protein ACVNF4_18360 [Streptomyces sp. S6]
MLGELGELGCRHPCSVHAEPLESGRCCVVVVFASEHSIGATVIRRSGCVRREWLIIGGGHRGTVRSDCRVDDADPAPRLDEAGVPVTSARWYLDRLEKAEREAEPG